MWVQRREGPFYWGPFFAFVLPSNFLLLFLFDVSYVGLRKNAASPTSPRTSASFVDFGLLRFLGENAAAKSGRALKGFESSRGVRGVKGGIRNGGTRLPISGRKHVIILFMEAAERESARIPLTEQSHPLPTAALMCHR